MRDEIFDRTYQAGRAQLNEGVDRALEKLSSGVVTTFRALHNIQFAAPWSKRSSGASCA